MGEKSFKNVLIALLVLLSIGLFLEIATRSNQYQWDFRVYYYAAKAYASGQDPYDSAVLSRIAGYPIRLPYTYPPATLFFFQLFASTDYDTAFYGFLALKCTFLIGLVYLWRKKFLPAAPSLLFYPFCLLAFNGAIYLDMRAGNITILEQGCIWLAFLFHLKGRRALFCVLILLGAAFRIAPIFFLFALWFSKRRGKLLYFFSSSILYICTLAVSYVVCPGLFSAFLTNLAGLDERGVRNPSTLALLRDVAGFLRMEAGIGISTGVEWGLYAVIVSALVLVTWRAWMALRSTETKDGERIELFLLCLVYALILPRFKDYGYILLIVPTCFMLWRMGSTKAYPLLFVLAVFPSRLLVSDGLHRGFALLCEYHPLIVAYCLWGVYIYEVFSLKAVRYNRGL